MNETVWTRLARRRRWSTDPVAFAREALGVELRPWQEKALRERADDIKRKRKAAEKRRGTT